MKIMQKRYSNSGRSSVYFSLSGGVVSPDPPACTSGRSFKYGHCLRRRRTPAAKAHTTPAVNDALFFCPGNSGGRLSNG
jgi:hypothetical protein